MSTRPLFPASAAPSALPTEQEHCGELIEFTRPGPALLPQADRCKWQLRRKLYVLLVVTDLALIYACFALGALVKFGALNEQLWLRVSLAATPLFLGIAIHNRAYGLEALKSPATSAGRAISALLAAFAVLFMISYFLKAEQDVSRLSLAVGGLAALVGVASSRKLLGDWLNKRYAGSLTTTIIITDEVFVEPPHGAVLRDSLSIGLRPEPRNPLMLHRLVSLVDGVDRVVIACRREASVNWAMLLKGASVHGEILTEELPSMGAVGVANLGSRTTLVVAAGPLSLQQRAIKRIFDIALTIPTLILILPVLAAIAIAIKLESKGPILFKQPRVGFGNKLFDVYKFRSMAADASDTLGSQSTARNDCRITRVGHFIRQTSLDELPQLLNVLNGTMSLVGPRPHALGSLAGPLPFWEVDDRYPHRHMLKPGITGLAQIRGYRGSTHEVKDLTRRLQSDLEYIAGWSIWRDMLIILKTIRVLVHQNAY